MKRVSLRRYRTIKPTLLYGRVLATHEIVKLPEDEGEELVESGHLVIIADPINGTWCDPIER